MNLRPAEATDLEALARIHAASFEAPWSAAELSALLNGPGVAALLAEDDGAFAFVLLRAVAGEAEILTLAVEPAWRGRGAGQALMTAAMTLAQAMGAGAVFLEVAEDNGAAMSLYRGLQFEAAGTRRAYYKRTDAPAVNAVVLRRGLNSRP